MRKKGKGSIGKAFSLVTQLSLTVLTGAGLFLALGLWLDERFGWSTTVPLLILGILGGAKGAYDLAKRLIDQSEDGND
mgnify:FL=1